MHEQLTLRSIEAVPVVIPLKRPVVSKVGVFRDWPLILIDLHTEEGIVGRSYLEPYLAHSMRYMIPALYDLAAARKGKRLAPMEDWQRDRAALNLVGYAGVTTIAVSGIDMAAWDALAKAAGLPLARYLGASTGPVPAYNSNGLWLTPVETLADEAAELVGEGGFTALKLRLGREHARDDLRAIAAIRERVGGDVRLMVDFNQGRTFGDALERCQALDDQGLYWFEEPVTYDNYDGYANLRTRLKTPLQIGENFYGPRDMHRAIAAGACDYVMPDLMRIGGITGWLRAAPIAAAAGIQVSTHLYPEVSAHLMRATETAHWLEWQDWADPVLAEPFGLRDGTILIPERPGCGIDWNLEAVRRYRIDG